MSAKMSKKVFFNICLQYNPHLHDTEMFNYVKNKFPLCKFTLKLFCFVNLGLKCRFRHKM